MIGNKLTSYAENRRANRVTWERPVWITQPVRISGRSVNASAVGLLVKVDWAHSLHKGDLVAFQIPRADGAAILTRHGRVAWLDSSGGSTFIGLEIV